MNEAEQQRYKAIAYRHKKISRYPWGNRGPAGKHEYQGGGTCVVGGKYQGMGESEMLAIVEKPEDAEFVINAPADIEWLLDKLARYMVQDE